MGHDGVPEFTGLEKSYVSWRKVFGNQIPCCAPRADDRFLGRCLRSRVHGDIADVAAAELIKMLIY
jgi:hypothetical protein